MISIDTFKCKVTVFHSLAVIVPSYIPKYLPATSS